MAVPMLLSSQSSRKGVISLATSSRFESMSSTLQQAFQEHGSAYHGVQPSNDELRMATVIIWMIHTSLDVSSVDRQRKRGDWRSYSHGSNERCSEKTERLASRS